MIAPLLLVRARLRNYDASVIIFRFSAQRQVIDATGFQRLREVRTILKSLATVSAFVMMAFLSSGSLRSSAAELSGNVRLLTKALQNDSTLQWASSPGRLAASHAVLWRDTTATECSA